MKTKHILFSCIMLGAFGLGAQDVHFSQITETPLLLNPAQAGLGHDVLAIINYKDQWRSVASPYKTFNAAADFALLKQKSGTHLGLGVDIFSDKAGDANMGTTMGQLHVAGIVALNSTNLLSVGVVGGYGQRSMSMAELTWGNQYDGQQYNPALNSGEPNTYSNLNYLDAGAGLSWFFSAGHSTLSSNDAKLFNIGAAVHHLNKPAYSFYGASTNRLPLKLVFHGNASIGMKNYNLVLEPSYFVALQGAHQEITPGMMFKYILGQSSKYTDRKKSSALSLGAYVRFKDAIVPTARYEFTNWSIGTSYDVNISGLTTASRSRGGFEISLRFMTPNPFSKTGSVSSFQ
ncbi:MAG: hypothetical protein FD123_4307 [Bacteroidetes bacterium]|nr:MAG: hypothetical protein FD123_4307 [Bacteroidota bacterium]